MAIVRNRDQQTLYPAHEHHEQKEVAGRQGETPAQTPKPIPKEAVLISETVEVIEADANKK